MRTGEECSDASAVRSRVPGAAAAGRVARSRTPVLAAEADLAGASPRSRSFRCASVRVSASARWLAATLDARVRRRGPGGPVAVAGGTGAGPGGAALRPRPDADQRGSRDAARRTGRGRHGVRRGGAGAVGGRRPVRGRRVAAAHRRRERPDARLRHARQSELRRRRDGHDAAADDRDCWRARRRPVGAAVPGPRWRCRRAP